MASGDTMIASAEPVFIRPDAVPAYFGAMSMGMAQMGPIMSSAKKKPADRHSAASATSRANNNGSSDRNAPTNRVQ